MAPRASTIDILPVEKTLAIIMGGGAGSRLFPLTKERAKPAVPLGGKYRLVDIPISNCLNSDVNSIFVLTQFNSTSLHHHINVTYKFDSFHKAFVEILAAQQTPEGSKWYQGTADAVRQNLRYFLERGHEYFLILSGDQLYQMDYRRVLAQHIESKSDITIATIPVSRDAAHGFGIMHTDSERRIIEFVEKPKEDAVLDKLCIPPPLLEELDLPADSDLYQASMGIYIFNRKVLDECLDNNLDDFGKNIIPAAIGKYRVGAYIFQGYWEDIGTIRSFFDANLRLTDPDPDYSFYHSGSVIYTRPRFLPASIVRHAYMNNAIIADGCIIERATLDRCLVGLRSIIRAETRLKNVVMMGADYSESDGECQSPSGIPLGIGKNCHIENTIIDKNARIGDNVVISPTGKSPDIDGEGYYIREGLVIIPKNSVIPSGTWI